jgi:hypothetical protein
MIACRRSVAGAAAFGGSEHLDCALLQCPAEPSGVCQGGGNAGRNRIDNSAHHFLAFLIAFAVRGDDTLLDTPVALASGYLQSRTRPSDARELV